MPEEVWGDELATMDLDAVLEFGCTHMTGANDRTVLRYPDPDGAARRLSQAANDTLGGVPVNQVHT
jgi:hypothetical protein